MRRLGVVRRAVHELLSVPQGVAGAAVMATAAFTAGAVARLADGRVSGWILAAAAVALLPADLLLLRWFARSIPEAERPPEPHPASRRVPEPHSNVRTPQTSNNDSTRP